MLSKPRFFRFAAAFFVAISIFVTPAVALAQTSPSLISLFGRGKFGRFLPSTISTQSGGTAGGGGLSGAQTPYGGRVLFMFPCTCNIDGSYQMTLSPPSAGTYLYSPFSLRNRYAYYAIPVPGVWHLGFYQSGGICMVGVEPYCYSIPITKGTITTVGTSAF